MSASGATARRTRWPTGSAVAATVLLLVAVAGAAAPWLAPHDPAAQLDLLRLKNAPPSGAHPFGTDPFSRDLLSRALYGARTSLGIGLLGALVSTVIAATWGMIAGSLPERLGDAVMGVVDTLRAIPRKIVLLAILLFFPQPSTLTLAILLGAINWTTLSRLVFVQVRVVRAREFVVSARALGASSTWVLTRHVAPHLAGSLFAASAVLVADLLAVEASLSFLGLGVRPPAASWGSILQDGVPYLTSAWWVAAVPCVLLVATVLSVAHLADALDARPERTG
jgi:peptide/nickel transport system permease protein